MAREKDTKYSTHHILPRSMGGNCDKKNLIEIRDTTHRAIHTLFENKMIAEQLIRTVDLSGKALRPDVKERLLEVLTSKDIDDPYERYSSKVIGGL